MAYTKKELKWHTEIKKISELVPYEKNPRQMTEKGMADLKKSIDTFGIAEPIVINTDNVIIGGHARYYTIKDNGSENVDCYIPDRKLTDKQVKELNIRLNKNIAGAFDFDILANEFELSKLIDWGFDKLELGMIDGVGFPALADGDKEPFQQMTFILSDEQAETVKRAIEKAKKENSFEDTGNENSNGNAIYFMAVSYL